MAGLTAMATEAKLRAVGVTAAVALAAVGLAEGSMEDTMVDVETEQGTMVEV